MTVFDMHSELGNLPKPDYIYVTSSEEAIRCLQDISKYNVISVDTETTGLDPFVDKIVLLQIGAGTKSYIFDVRDGNVDATIFKPILESDKQLKLFQNAVFDAKFLKYQYNIRLFRIYDTMLAEQLLYLGFNVKASLDHLVDKYLKIHMPKESATTFKDYYQKYSETQLIYAANDTLVLPEIYNLQLAKLMNSNLVRAAKLEFDFVRALSEMELNGMLLNIDKWRELLSGIETERNKVGIQLRQILGETSNQNTLFDVSLINLDSPIQVVKALNKLGINVKSTDVKELKKYGNSPVVKLLLEYRKHEKFLTTYGEALIERVHFKTGRLHSDFRQMVATGRLSSSNPNLQNIPSEKIYRACFVAQPGHNLITCDMSQAELRILAAYSKDPVFLEAFEKGLDLHARTAADLFGVTYDEVLADKKLPDDDPNKKHYRSHVKSLNFGLVYGLTKVGLAIRLGVSEEKAQKLIDMYFSKYTRVAKWLEAAGKFALQNGYALTRSGRRRHFRIPEPSDPEYNRLKGHIERQGKNTPIQGCLDRQTLIKGCGRISKLVGKKIIELDTGFGINSGIGVYSGKRKLYKVVLSNGIELNITSNHKIPVISNDGEFVDKTIFEIDKDNDFLLIPLNIVDGIVTDLSGYKYVKGHWRETYVEYKYPSVMNEKLAFIIGCLIGDGNYSKHNTIQFVCPNNQKELFDKFNSYVTDVFGYIPIINKQVKKDNVLLMSGIYSVVIRGFLRHIGLDYVVHRNKVIPEYFFTETLKNKGALLNGLFSTDGGVTAESGPNYTTVSYRLAHDIQQLLLSMGINSNLKTYTNQYGNVYRLQVPKRFVKRFLELIDVSVKIKHGALVDEASICTGRGRSLVPRFIPECIYKALRNSDTYNDLSYNEKCHLRRLKLGSCSFTSWRKFYNLLSSSIIKNYLSFFINFDFCQVKNVSKEAVEMDAYDIICDRDPHYYTANGVVLHNSNADTIKQAMIYIVDRIDKAKLLSTVHDEVIVEAKEEDAEEVAHEVSRALCDGFAEFVPEVQMVADAVIKDYWSKD